MHNKSIVQDLKQHIHQFSDCKLCSLCNHRTKMAFYRGHRNPMLLFIGEAPGPEEDRHGIPFIGPSGELLNEVLDRVSIHISDKQSSFLPSGISIPPMSFGITNTIACIPRDDIISPFRKPEPEELDACKDRLRDMIRICEPIALVAVGKVADDYLVENIGSLIHDPITGDLISECPMHYSPQGFTLKKYFKKQNYLIPILNIRHPSFVLRQSKLKQEQMKSNMVTDIAEFYRMTYCDFHDISG